MPRRVIAFCFLAFAVYTFAYVALVIESHIGQSCVAKALWRIHPERSECLFRAILAIYEPFDMLGERVGFPTLAFQLIPMYSEDAEVRAEELLYDR